MWNQEKMELAGLLTIKPLIFLLISSHLVVK
jgi:hypothetical protein